MNCHPLATLFPLMEGKAFEELRESIKAHGQNDPIIMQGNLIVDGRNRQRACDALGRTVKQAQFETLGLTCSIPEYIWDKNRNRRDLTDDQKAMIEIKWKKQYQDEGLKAKSEGGKTAGVSRPKKDVTERSQPISRAPTSRKKMAAEAGVSERKIRQADTVDENTPELAEEVMAGKMKLVEAVKQAEVKAKPAPPVQPEPANGKRQVVYEKAEKRRTIALLSAIEGSCDGLDGLKIDLILSGFSEEELGQWVAKATELSGRIRTFAKKLKKGNGESSAESES